MVRRTTIFRVHPDGSHRQKIVTQNAYGFADLTVVRGDSVVFSSIPNDYGLWRHRKGGITARKLRVFGPVPNIEEVRPGGKPRVLIREADFPAVQP